MAGQYGRQIVEWSNSCLNGWAGGWLDEWAVRQLVK